MRTRRRPISIIVLALIAGAPASPPASAQDERPINYQDDVKPIIDEYCIFCHRGSRARNGFKLDNAAGIFEGGSSGPGIVPGDPDGSLMYQLIARTREPYMPYEDDPLPAEMLETIRKWIESGARETAESRPKATKPKPDIELVVETTAGNKPAGEPAMPADLRLDPYWWSEKASTITAMAASPWAPVVAVSGHRQVVLHHAQTLALLGVLEFPEGVINSLKFSRNGEVLIAGGGESAARGLVVGWSVRTGERLFEIGEEPDAVLAADITNDQRLVAMGGPAGMVRVYVIESGSLLYEIDVHTDWVTALEFSPDGVLLATGDRAGGLFVWAADTGREFHKLPPHQPHVKDVSWRSDSNVLATCGEDGAVRLFEMERGQQIKAWSSHGGALSVEFTSDGRLATCGRDQLARLWDANGTQLKQFGPMGGLATELAVAHDASRVFIGDWGGAVAAFNAADGANAGTLDAYPTTRTHLAVAAAGQRVEQLTTRVTQLEQKAAEAQQTLAARSEEARAAAEQARQAEEQAANADSKAATLTTQAQSAQAAATPLQSELARKRQARDELAAQLESARAKAAEAQSGLDAAMAEALAAERALHDADEANRAAAQDRHARASKLLDGATALAQMAAAKVAELEIALKRSEAELSDWQAFVQPRLDEADQLSQARAAANAEAESLRAQAHQKRSTADELASVLTELQSQADAAQAAVESANAELDAARVAAQQAAARWQAQRAAIAEARGRVPD